jgi:hypothetical protein
VLLLSSVSEGGVLDSEVVLVELLILRDDKEEHVLRSSISTAVVEDIEFEMADCSELRRRSLGQLEAGWGDEDEETGKVDEEAEDLLSLHMDIAGDVVEGETTDISTGAKASISSCFKKRRAT